MNLEKIVEDLKENNDKYIWDAYKDDLIKRIYRDFPHEDILLKDELAVDFLSNNNEERIFLEYHLYGMTWRNLLDDGQTVYDMNYDVGFLSNKAFVYYLPAYLVLTLEEFNEPKIYDYIVGCNEIIPSLFFSHNFLENNWNQFNKEQKKDIIIFFLLIIKNPYQYFYDVDEMCTFLSNLQINIK